MTQHTKQLEKITLNFEDEEDEITLNKEAIISFNLSSATDGLFYYETVDKIINYKNVGEFRLLIDANQLDDENMFMDPYATGLEQTGLRDNGMVMAKIKQVINAYDVKQVIIHISDGSKIYFNTWDQYDGITDDKDKGFNVATHFDGNQYIIGLLIDSKQYVDANRMLEFEEYVKLNKGV